MDFEEWALEYYGCDPAYFSESKDAKAAWEAGFKRCQDLINTAGYVIVPVEPTKEIVVAGVDEIEGVITLSEVHNAYKAMIRSAQAKE